MIGLRRAEITAAAVCGLRTKFKREAASQIDSISTCSSMYYTETVSIFAAVYTTIHRTSFWEASLQCCTAQDESGVANAAGEGENDDTGSAVNRPLRMIGELLLESEV